MLPFFFSCCVLMGRSGPLSEICIDPKVLNTLGCAAIFDPASVAQTSQKLPDTFWAL
jgi:hypothetical protein